ncbi:MAG TPA: hypothetical protein VN442_21110 [Bryobacteraceae bacterium]|nr:hypothetical protein [Bryobacteraceae bacterium]
MTTTEILDALEAGILALRSRNGSAPGGPGAMAGAALRVEIARAGLSAGDFAKAAGVGRQEVEDWIEERIPVPGWIPAAIRILALLTPSARRTLLNGSATNAGKRPDRSHPFSRIEEL